MEDKIIISDNGAMKCEFLNRNCAGGISEIDLRAFVFPFASMAGITSFHQSQVTGYLRYIRIKRESLAADLESQFDDAKSKCVSQ